jgi:hypothetical protein
MKAKGLTPLRTEGVGILARSADGLIGGVNVGRYFNEVVVDRRQRTRDGLRQGLDAEVYLLLGWTVEQMKSDDILFLRLGRCGQPAA